MKTKQTFATILLAFMVCYSLAAFAQRVIDFNALPRTDVILPVPNGFGGMNWGNFDYVTDQLITDTNNFAFPALYHKPWTATMSAEDPSEPYRPVGMTVRGQYGTTLTLYAYNRGVFVGSKSYPIAPVFTPIRTPAEWGAITQITFAATDSQHQSAIFNLFNLTLQ